MIGFLLTGVSVAFLMSARGKPTRDRLVLRLPVVKGIVNYSILERFCRVLSAMLEAGVPLPGSNAGHDRVDEQRRVRLEARDGSQQRWRAAVSPDRSRPTCSRERPARCSESAARPERSTLSSRPPPTTSIASWRCAQRFVGMFEPAMILFVGGVGIRRHRPRPGHVRRARRMQ
ncbi:MAG: hypothetical protein R2705_06660 [Ilumatobacteraceae bacterium]